MKILVLAVEGLHLGYLGCYGNDWIGTPTLDRLAAEGVVFDRHFADCPEPTAARRAWRTGLYQLPEMVEETGQKPAPPADLIGLLRAQGIGTTLIAAKKRPWAREFAKGWEHVEWVPAKGEGTLLERCLEATLAGLDRLESQDQGLVWLDLPTLLPPWEIPEEDLGAYLDDGEEEEPLEPVLDPEIGVQPVQDDLFLRLQRTYAAAVSYLDAGLGLLWEEIRQRGLDDALCIVVHADRGLALGEHDLVGETRPWLHEERVHVPLIVRTPDKSFAGKRTSALTQSVDLAPTLLDWFGMAMPSPCHGQSLLPLLRGEVEAIRPYALAGQRLDEGLEYALRTPEWSLVLPVQSFAGDAPRGTHLYVQPDDRWEVNDVHLHHMEWVEQLEKLVGQVVPLTCQPGPLLLPPVPELAVNPE